MTNKEITNIIIRDILSEALEDEWGTSISHRILNHSVLDGLDEEENETIHDNIDAIVFDVKDAINKLNVFLASVG